MPQPKTTPEPKVRLLKLIVQPTFVVDDGEHLREVPVGAVQVDPAGLEAFVELGLDEMAKQVIEKLAELPPSPAQS